MVAGALAPAVGELARPAATLRVATLPAVPRPSPIAVAGKFLAVDGKTFFVRGVTYGPFAPEPDGCEYHTPAVVDADFAAMAARGFNVVRTYTPPPQWVLDLAQAHGLRVLVGLPWEQHVVFLETAARQRAIAARLRRAIASCARHPAVLGYTVGNEIPAPIVRWHGRRPIEGFIRRLYEEAKSAHPEALVTYVNFPTTEYLELPFLDFFAWNVYLESPDTLARYLARLQNLAGEKPLLLAEVGLDSQRNGEVRQAEVLDWQIRTAGAAGCAGAILFSWTDEWQRSGHQILDWDFGLTDRSRRPKRALDVTSAAFAEFPLPDAGRDWPLVSVVICTYNGARTLRQTLAAVCALDYPRYEVIVVNDGSTDATAAIAAEFPVRLISTDNHGLSHARNLGMRESLGELIAYIDDDAYPDHHWLRYLAHTFLTTDHAAVGGPNVCPETDGEVARSVSHAPGGPCHVLLSDTVAEHIPGCNMAFRRRALLDVGGFDEQFRIAGDDVDLCWRLQEEGKSIGFQPAAMVWHHSRSAVRAYLRQQYNYGRAEAMLENKWPGKYNTAGHPRWTGRLYGRGRREALGLRRGRVHHGVWGSGLFQSLYSRQTGVVESLPLMPEWYLLIALLTVLSIASVLWHPLLWSIPFLVAAAAPLVSQSVAAARHAELPWRSGERLARARMRARIAWLHLLQPVMRLRGRLSYGLHPLRRTAEVSRFVLPRPRTHLVWDERWRSAEARLENLERRLNLLGARTVRGSAFDGWDLEVRGGLLGGVRLLMAIEEHGHGRQMVRVKSWPAPAKWLPWMVAGLLPLIALALAFNGEAAAAVLAGLLMLLVTLSALDSAVAGAVCVEERVRRAAAADAPQDHGRAGS